MLIKEIELFTSNLKAQKDFYSNKLGAEIIFETAHSFSVQMGQTTVKWVQSNIDFKYHYCYLIPSNQLQDAMDWAKSRFPLVNDDTDSLIQHFKTWNAHSFYFWDGAGNLVEFICRHDLNNESHSGFNINSIINFNEIGMPNADIKGLNKQLEKSLGTQFWKGDIDRFGTNGDQNGLFILLNTKEKKTWFPTELEPMICDFKAIIESHEFMHSIQYISGQFMDDL